MSYGRTAAVFDWAQDNFSYFDAWCCARGIDPIELPAYRFYNLVMYVLKDDLTPEGLSHLEQMFQRCDDTKHPLLLLKTGRRKENVVAGAAPTAPRKREAYVPPWWQGEAGYKNAQAAMAGVHALPKSAT